MCLENEWGRFLIDVVGTIKIHHTRMQQTTTKTRPNNQQDGAAGFIAPNCRPHQTYRQQSRAVVHQGLTDTRERQKHTNFRKVSIVVSPQL